VNAAYQDFPLSTEQVLHPEKFIAGGDPPQRLVLPEALGQAVSATLIQDNVLGEFGLRLLLEEYTTTEEAFRAAQGWGGDCFRVWRRESGEGGASWLVLLVTTWDSAADAQEFFAVYGRLVGNKYQKAEEEPPGGPTRRLWRTERGLVEVALRGSDVLVLEGFRAEERESLWRALSGYRKEVFRWQPPEPAAVPAGSPAREK
jgi:hypothetical protein